MQKSMYGGLGVIADKLDDYIPENAAALKQFAKDNNCEGISGYTDLEYLKNKVQEYWPDASTRYFFYLPIK